MSVCSWRRNIHTLPLCLILPSCLADAKIKPAPALPLGYRGWEWNSCYICRRVSWYGAKLRLSVLPSCHDHAPLSSLGVLQINPFLFAAVSLSCISQIFTDFCGGHLPLCHRLARVVVLVADYLPLSHRLASTVAPWRRHCRRVTGLPAPIVPRVGYAG